VILVKKTATREIGGREEKEGGRNIPRHDDLLGSKF